MWMHEQRHSPQEQCLLRSSVSSRKPLLLTFRILNGYFIVSFFSRFGLGDESSWNGQLDAVW
jgi:hypothetical protein